LPLLPVVSLGLLGQVLRESFEHFLALLLLFLLVASDALVHGHHGLVGIASLSLSRSRAGLASLSTTHSSEHFLPFDLLPPFVLGDPLLDAHLLEGFL